MLVTGEQLLDLKLYISVPDTSHEYVLEFVESDEVQDENVPGTPTKPVVHVYRMRWRDPASTGGLATDYCFAASDGTDPDPVVFQQGIDVDPDTGIVTRGASTAGLVTMSCLRGAPATVYRWGYAYREPTPLFFFAAAIHMKRASYCADEHHYTTVGTPIAIADEEGINNDPIEHLEARWDDLGALCVDELRHPELKFQRECNGTPLPSCDSIDGKLTNGL
jgi:hypothetical protein